MKYSIEGNPSFGILKILLEAPEDKEYILADAGAMIYQDSNIGISSGLYGGIGDVVKRVLFAKEYAFLNKFFLKDGEKGEVAFAPGYPGSVLDVFMEGGRILARPGSFLALVGKNIGITGRVGNTSSFFSMKGLSFLSVEGDGVFFLSGFGSIVELDVESSCIVDTGHVLAYTEGLDVKIKPIGNFKSFIFSKEGLVADFRGRGKVWVQTRNEKDYAYFNEYCASQIKSKK